VAVGLQLFHKNFDYVVIVLNLMNLAFDGLRICQVPCMLTSHLLIFFDNKIIGVIGFIISILLRISYGEGDFSRIQNRGKYKVGFKEIFVESNAVSVFYPTHDSGSLPWLRYGRSTNFTSYVQAALGW
jgi:hypothetical protein